MSERAAGNILQVNPGNGKRRRWGFWVSVWDGNVLVHELRSHTTFADAGHAQERLREVLEILNRKEPRP